MPGEGYAAPPLARRGGLTNLPSSARLPKLLRPIGPERAKNQGLIFRTNHNPCLPHESTASCVVSSCRRGEPSPRVLEHSGHDSTRRKFDEFWSTAYRQTPWITGFPRAGRDKKREFWNRESSFANEFQYSKIRHSAPSPSSPSVRAVLRSAGRIRIGERVRLARAAVPGIGRRGRLRLRGPADRLRGRRGRAIAATGFAVPPAPIFPSSATTSRKPAPQRRSLGSLPDGPGSAAAARVQIRIDHLMNLGRHHRVGLVQEARRCTCPTASRRSSRPAPAATASRRRTSPPRTTARPWQSRTSRRAACRTLRASPCRSRRRSSRNAVQIMNDVTM